MTEGFDVVFLAKVEGSPNRQIQHSTDIVLQGLDEMGILLAWNGLEKTSKEPNKPLRVGFRVMALKGWSISAPSIWAKTPASNMLRISKVTFFFSRPKYQLFSWNICWESNYKSPTFADFTKGQSLRSDFSAAYIRDCRDLCPIYARASRTCLGLSDARCASHQGAGEGQRSSLQVYDTCRLKRQEWSLDALALNKQRVQWVEKNIYIKGEAIRCQDGKLTIFIDLYLLDTTVGIATLLSLSSLFPSSSAVCAVNILSIHIATKTHLPRFSPCFTVISSSHSQCPSGLLPNRPKKHLLPLKPAMTTPTPALKPKRLVVGVSMD